MVESWNRARSPKVQDSEYRYSDLPNSPRRRTAATYKRYAARVALRLCPSKKLVSLVGFVFGMVIPFLVLVE